MVGQPIGLETAPEGGPRRTPQAARRGLQLVLFIVGVAVVAGLVVQAGPSEVRRLLIAAGPLVPVIVGLDLAYYTLETLAHRVLLGAHRDRAPVSAYVRAGLVAYVVSVLLPLGRGGAEVARTASLGPYLGVARVSAAGAQLLPVSLFANAICSSAIAVVAACYLGAQHPLFFALLLNALATAGLGALLAFGMRHAVWSLFLRRWFPAAVSFSAAFQRALRQRKRDLWAAFGLCVLSRFAETLVRGCILLAVGGSVTWASALLLEGVHLVGGTLGDAVPGQLGALEGTYWVFADVFSERGAAATAVSMALLGRVAQLLLALLGLVGWWTLPRAATPTRDTPLPSP